MSLHDPTCPNTLKVLQNVQLLWDSNGFYPPEFGLEVRVCCPTPRHPRGEASTQEHADIWLRSMVMTGKNIEKWYIAILGHSLCSSWLVPFHQFLTGRSRTILYRASAQACLSWTESGTETIGNPRKGYSKKLKGRVSSSMGDQVLQ